MELLYRADNIQIFLDARNRIMYCNWIGFQEPEILMKTGAMMLKLLKERGLSKIINDNRKVRATWSHSSNWTSATWFPMMQKAGLKTFAWILSPNIFAEHSAKEALPGVEVKVRVKFFVDYDEAQEWIMLQED